MKIWPVLLAFVVSLPLTVKAAEKAEYKCFVNGRLGEQVVFYRWKVAEYKMKVKTLPGRSNVTSSGEKYLITEVIECKGVEEEFVNASAKQLDAITLR